MSIAAFTTQSIGPDASIAFFINAGLGVDSDVTAPVLTLPTGLSTGKLTASGTVTTDEGNGTLSFYASINSTETAAVIIASGDSQSVSATGIQNVVVIGLAAATTYFLHFVHVDTATNQSNVVSSASFTTDALGTGQGPKQGEELVFYFALSKGGSFVSGPALSEGDFLISKDGVTFGNMTNLPVVSPLGDIQIKGTLTSAETTGTEHVGVKCLSAAEVFDPLYIPIDIPSATIIDVNTKTSQMIFTKTGELDVNTKSINSAGVVGDGNATPWDGE